MCVFCFGGFFVLCACVWAFDLAAGLCCSPSPCLLFPIAAVKADSACCSCAGNYTRWKHTYRLTPAGICTQMFQIICVLIQTDTEITHVHTHKKGKILECKVLDRNSEEIWTFTVCMCMQVEATWVDVCVCLFWEQFPEVAFTTDSSPHANPLILDSLGLVAQAPHFSQSFDWQDLLDPSGLPKQGCLCIKMQISLHITAYSSSWLPVEVKCWHHYPRSANWTLRVLICACLQICLLTFEENYNYSFSFDGRLNVIHIFFFE